MSNRYLKVTIPNWTPDFFPHSTAQGFFFFFFFLNLSWWQLYPLGRYLGPKAWSHLCFSLVYSTFNLSGNSAYFTFQIHTYSSHFPLPPYDDLGLHPHHLSPGSLHLPPYGCSCLHLCSFLVCCQHSKRTDALKCKNRVLLCFSGFHFILKAKVLTLSFKTISVTWLPPSREYLIWTLRRASTDPDIRGLPGKSPVVVNIMRMVCSTSM